MLVMLALVAAAFLGLSVFSFITGHFIIGILLIVVLLFYACFLFCLRNRVHEGIVLLKAASSFLAARPSVFIAPLYIMLFVIIF